MAYRIKLNLSRPEAELVKTLIEVFLNDGDLVPSGRDIKVFESINRDIDKQIDASRNLRGERQ